MIKTIPPGSYDFHEPPTKLLKVARSGLRGNDLSELIKTAGSHVAKIARDIAWMPGEVPLHNIAIGATEAVGCNKNGDGFSIATCMKSHPTFKKYARQYRDHENRDPAKSYGVIKESFYNDAMKRIELFIALNGTKEAADRNGGLVADRELNILESGKDLATSMACMITRDKCSSCGNMSHNRSEYCLGTEEGGHCKHGGLRHHMGRVCDDGHQLHADNPAEENLRFFDNSHVIKQADRTAYATGRLDHLLKKAADAGKTLGGAEVAELLEVGAPLPMLLSGMEPWLQALVKRAARLQYLENRIKNEPCIGADYCNMGLASAEIDPLPSKVAKALPHALRALSMRNAVLPASAFLRLAAGAEKAAALSKRVDARLPGIHGRLLMKLERGESLPVHDDVLDGTPSAVFSDWAGKQASAHAIDAASVQRRAMRMSLCCHKTAQFRSAAENTDDHEADDWAQRYALYELQALAPMDNNPERAFIEEMLVRRHYFA